MSWELFEAQAVGYEGWYATRRGTRVGEAEVRLLDWLLSAFPAARTALEVGCGSGHFTRWLAARLPHAVGLDRSAAMLAQARRLDPGLRLLQADASALPFLDSIADVVVFVTALEFLDHADQALGEAVRVARQGLALIVLNRWSGGGLSRRWGPQSRRAILSRAHDYALAELHQAVSQAAGARLTRVRWRSAVFPGFLWRLRAQVALGDVLGVATRLEPGSGRRPPVNAPRHRR